MNKCRVLELAACHAQLADEIERVESRLNRAASGLGLISFNAGLLYMLTRWHPGAGVFFVACLCACGSLLYSKWLTKNLGQAMWMANSEHNEMRSQWRGSAGN